jgi:4-amino-4-deoxychorismate lyase
MPHIYTWDVDRWTQPSGVTGLNAGAGLGMGLGLDRGLQFGDGLFETMRLNAKGESPLMPLHQGRLKKGLAVLGFSSDAITTVERAMSKLSDITLAYLSTHTSSPITPTSAHNQSQAVDCCPDDGGVCSGVKIIVTRGNSTQGYGAIEGIRPNIYAVTFEPPILNPTPALINVGVNPVTLGEQPLLAGLKHLNRIEQVLARQKFQPEWSESIMLNQKSQIVEGCMSNIFVNIDNQWLTPPMDNAGVDGVVRQWLLSMVDKISVEVIPLKELASAQAICFSNSLSGFREVQALDGQSLLMNTDVTDWQMHYKSLFDEC